MQRVTAQGAREARRPQEERGQRERAAFALAAAYTLDISPPPAARSTVSSSSNRRRRGDDASCRPRPGSAKSYRSSRPAPDRGGAAGRTASACSSYGWGRGGDDNKLRLEFRLRREAAARGRRGVTARGGGREAIVSGGGGTLRVVDLEELEDENHRLKLALNRAAEETKAYRVNGVRLEGELLRADGNVEALIAELEQAPSKRNERALNAVRCKVKKSSMVRTLVNQKRELQQQLNRRDEELETIKHGKEWSAMAEMTAATEEYFVEIQRLRRLLLIKQQCSAKNTPSSATDYCPADAEGGGGTGAEEGVRSPSRYCASLRDRVSGVSGTAWSCAQQQRLGVESVEADGAQRGQPHSRSRRLVPEHDDHGETAGHFFARQGARHTQAPDIKPIIPHEQVLRREYKQGNRVPGAREHVTPSEIPDGGPYHPRVSSGKSRQRRPPSSTRRGLPARPAQIPTRAARAARASSAATAAAAAAATDALAVGGGSTNSSTPQNSRRAPRSTPSRLESRRSDYKDNDNISTRGKGRGVIEGGSSGGPVAERLALSSTVGTTSGYGQARSRGRPLSAPSRRRQAEESLHSAPFLRNKQQRLTWRRSNRNRRFFPESDAHGEGRSASSSHGVAIGEEARRLPAGSAGRKGDNKTASKAGMHDGDDDDDNGENGEGWSNSPAIDPSRREEAVQADGDGGGQVDGDCGDQSDGDAEGVPETKYVDEKTVLSLQSAGDSCRGGEWGKKWSSPHEARDGDGSLTVRSSAAFDTRSEQERSRRGRTRAGIADDEAHSLDEHRLDVGGGVGRGHIAPTLLEQAQGESATSGLVSASGNTGHATSSAIGGVSIGQWYEEGTSAGGGISGGNTGSDDVIEQTNVVPPAVSDFWVADSSGDCAVVAAVGAAASKSGVNGEGDTGSGISVEYSSVEEEEETYDRSEVEEADEAEEEDDVVEEEEENEVVEEEGVLEGDQVAEEEPQELEQEKTQVGREEEGDDPPPLASTACQQHASLDDDNDGDNDNGSNNSNTSNNNNNDDDNDEDSDDIYNVEPPSPQGSWAGEEDAGGPLAAVVTAEDERTVYKTPDDGPNSSDERDHGGLAGDAKGITKEEELGTREEGEGLREEEEKGEEEEEEKEEGEGKQRKQEEGEEREEEEERNGKEGKMKEKEERGAEEQEERGGKERRKEQNEEPEEGNEEQGRGDEREKKEGGGGETKDEEERGDKRKEEEGEGGERKEEQEEREGVVEKGEEVVGKDEREEREEKGKEHKEEEKQEREQGRQGGEEGNEGEEDKRGKEGRYEVWEEEPEGKEEDEEKDEVENRTQDDNADNNLSGLESRATVDEVGGGPDNFATITVQERDSSRTDARHPITTKNCGKDVGYSSSRSDATATGGEHPSASETQGEATGLILSNGDGAVDDEDDDVDVRVASEANGDMSEYMDDFDEEGED